MTQLFSIPIWAARRHTCPVFSACINYSKNHSHIIQDGVQRCSGGDRPRAAEPPTWRVGGPPPSTARLHTSPPRPDDDRSPQTQTQRQRLKLAVRDYGATVVVFHVAISLASLGLFYTAVKSGLDVVGLLRWAGLGDSVTQSRLVAGGSTFVLAYAVHKVFAPVRIATTLACTPLIVRSLRRRGVLRTPPARGD